MFTLEAYDKLAKHRAILDLNGNPVAWIDYDDVNPAEADVIADKMLASLNGGFIAGILDEVEFMGQMPERHGISVYGLFSTEDAARECARRLSTDPDEAVVVPVKTFNG